MAVVTQIQVRRGTAASWTSANPTLAAGEWGYETDTGFYKIGNGSTAWNSLSYTPNYQPLTINAQTVSYVLVAGDNGELVEMNVGSANTLTVPPNSSVPFGIGSQITVLQTGAGQTTLTPGAGVTINGTPGLKLRAQWSSATLIKRATDTWVAIGDLSA
jgi:hypothetical protein